MKNKYLLRIIILLPVFIIFLVSALRHCFKLTWTFIKHGGEFMNYSEKVTPDTISEVYEELVNQREAETDLNNTVVIFTNMKKALRLVVQGYEDDGLEHMDKRDSVFYKTCKEALEFEQKIK